MFIIWFPPRTKAKPYANIVHYCISDTQSCAWHTNVTGNLLNAHYGQNAIVVFGNPFQSFTDLVSFQKVHEYFYGLKYTLIILTNDIENMYTQLQYPLNFVLIEAALVLP